MAGHSKWSQIKRKKAVTDSRRGKLWTKLLKEVTVASRLGGADPSGNPRLRVAIQEARAKNVPNDNLERAIKRGSGDLDGVNYEELTYEGYGPSGVAILVETITDNRNRTVSEVRHLLAKSGGNLGENGCVGWMFEKRGYLAFATELMSEEEFMELAVEVEAEDFSIGEEAYELFTSAATYQATRDALDAKEIELSAYELGMVASNLVKVEGDKATSVVRLLEALEDNDDVQHVWSNFEVDDAVLASLE